MRYKAALADAKASILNQARDVEVRVDRQDLSARPFNLTWSNAAAGHLKICICRTHSEAGQKLSCKHVQALCLPLGPNV